MNNKYLNITDGGFNHIKSYYHEFSKPYIEYNKEDNKIYYEQPLDTNYDYVEIGGIKWATKCIGATSPYTYDAWFFQWGETQGHINLGGSIDYAVTWETTPFNNNNFDYNESYWKTISGNVCDNNGCLLSEYDAATQLMGKDWRIPNHNELSILLEHRLEITDRVVTGFDGTIIQLQTTSGIGVVNNVQGLCFGETTTSKDKILFIPIHGFVWKNSPKIVSIGNSLFLFGSNIYADEPNNACILAYHMNQYLMTGGLRASARNILPIKL